MTQAEELEKRAADFTAAFDSLKKAAGGTKEFHLTDVVVEDAQLDTTVIYRLSWKESELLIDSEDGTTTTIEHERETEAEIRIERFVENLYRGNAFLGQCVHD